MSFPVYLCPLGYLFNLNVGKEFRGKKVLEGSQEIWDRNLLSPVCI